MRPSHRKSRPRHLAGSERTPWQPRLLDADFDVVAALDGDADYDFDALFADEGVLDEAPAPRVRVARHKVAFAVSVTLAAVPLLVLDNFPATAESPGPSQVQSVAGAAEDTARTVATLPETLPSSEVPPVEVTIAKATIFVGEPTTTTTAAAQAVTTTTAKPTTTTTTARPTTTTAKPTTTTTAPAPPAVSAAPVPPDPNDPNTWERLARCESGGNWQAVSKPRNGMQYYGGLQFSLTTWQGLGGQGYPHEAPKATQIEMGKKLQVRQGWKAWPTCARQLGWL